MANEEYICGFWVHIHFAVYGNAVALLSQTLFAHFEGELEFKNLKEGVLKCKKCYDSNIVDVFLQQGRKNIKLSEDESSALTPLGPDFNFGVCPSSSSSTSYDSEPVKEH